VGRMAAAYLSLSRAIYAGVAGLREMDEARQTAAQRQLESKQTLGSLTQLVESDEGVARLVRLSKQIYAHGGGETLDQAGRVAFSLQSAGLQDSARIFTDMKSTGVVDQPDVMARAVKTMISSFGTEEAGSVNQILSKAFAASKFNPAEVEPLLEAASGAGSFARALKISDEEVLAATALQAEEVGTPSGGGTRVAALLRQIGKITEEGTGEASFEGMDLKEIITEIGRVAPTPGKLTDLLGERSESLAAFRGLQLKMEEYDKVLAEIKRLQDADTAAQKVAMARRIPEVRAAELQNIGRARKELGETDFGVTRNLTDAMIDGAKRLAKERRDQTGGGRWAEFKDAMRFKFVEAARLVQGDEAVLRDVAPRIPELELGDEVRRNLNRIDRQRTGPGGAGDRWDWSARPEIPKEPAPKPVAEDLAPSASTSAPTSASKPTASHQDTSAAESLAAMREMVGLLNAGNTHLEGIKEASRQPTLSDPGRDH